MEMFLSAARFVSPLLIPARLAQIWTGIPASIMLAEAWFLGPYSIGTREVPNPLNDYFDTGRPFSSIETSFLDHANRLTRDRRFQAVMEAKDDPVEYLKQVGLCKCWDDLDRRDRVAFIADSDFLECDGFEVG